MVEVNSSIIEDLRSAVDVLALALAGNGHSWTASQRKAYEKANRILDMLESMEDGTTGFVEPK